MRPKQVHAFLLGVLATTAYRPSPRVLGRCRCGGEFLDPGHLPCTVPCSRGCGGPSLHIGWGPSRQFDHHG